MSLIQSKDYFTAADLETAAVLNFDAGDEQLNAWVKAAPEQKGLAGLTTLERGAAFVYSTGTREIVGVAGICPSVRRHWPHHLIGGNSVLHIVGLAVDVRFHGMECERAILQDLIREAVVCDAFYQAITVDVPASNASLTDLFTGAGFVRIGEPFDFGGSLVQAMMAKLPSS